MSVSVVVPNYNHGKLLPRAIGALMAQRPPPADIIIINDASTDDSLSVIDALKARYPCIRLINHDQNRGVVASMNEGLHAATAEFVYFAAADDFSLPGIIAGAQRALAQHPDAAFYCGRVVLVDPDGRILGFRPFMQPASSPTMLTPSAARAEFAKSDNWSVGPGVIYRRDRLLAAGGFDETMGAFCDGIVVRRLALESGFFFDSALVAAWEIYPQSLSARSALSVTENTKLIDKAIAGVKAGFPADMRDRYADLLSRRLRFNMARLWLVFDTRTIETAGLAEVLQFTGMSRRILNVAASLPLARLMVLAWMALVLRPYGIGAIVAGWYRAKRARLFETKAVAKTIAALRNPAP